MNAEISILTKGEEQIWDAYVLKHPNSNLYHLSGWKAVIENVYGHPTHYLLAKNDRDEIAGILPLVHLKHFLFGSNLVSMPYFDMAGVLADDAVLEKSLISEAVRIAIRLNADAIELRNAIDSVLDVEGLSFLPDHHINAHCSLVNRSHKTRMILELPESSERLWKSFKSKLRSQIRKPEKEGLQPEIGGKELLDDFYQVFVVNMRDLGSPVHSKKILAETLLRFEDTSRVVMVYLGGKPIACSLVIGFRGVLENPWASSLREHSRLSPNMLLYWTMLAYACDNGYKKFDFGRSSPDEGTYKFKKQWGAELYPLNWHYIDFSNKISGESILDKAEFQIAAQVWKKLPVSATKIFGPAIRKHIAL